MKSFLPRKLLLLTLLLSSLYSSEVTIQWLKEQPKSYARDFYILQFFNQDITPTQANEALELIHNMNYTLFYAYAKKLQHDETYAVVQCLKAGTEELLTTNADCISLGLSTYDMTTLTYQQKKDLYENLISKYPKKAEVVNILNAPLPFTRLIASPSETFFDTFNKVGSTYRQTYFNYKIPTKKLLELKETKEFNQMIRLIVTDRGLENVKQSLLTELFSSTMTDTTLFYLGLNALMHEQKDLSIDYFTKALQKSYQRFEKDKITFWLYLTTQNKEYLTKLDESTDINIYTLYAKEQLNTQFSDIIYTLKPKASKPAFDVTNPFVWFKQKQKFAEGVELSYFENLFTNEFSMANLAYFYEKYYKYQKHYFITPYESYLKDTPFERKALIYALGKQESHLVASSISPVYALGAMQIMPFLAKHLASKRNEPFNIYAQLDPKVNIAYANEHLDYLETHLNHPLWVAYAYNGGIGFTQRMLKTDLFDLKKKEYEPFLSMELVPFEESRKYGKKVLVNYIMYYNFFNPKKKITLTTLLQTLKKPDRK